MTIIRDIMSKQVAVIRPRQLLAEAVEILSQHHIGGVPVVSGDGTLLGVISETELIDVVFDTAAKLACPSRNT